MSKKVLIICPFTYPSACGIWNRVYNDAKSLMAAGYEVHVFSSNILKGTDQELYLYEEYEGIKIHRFKVKFKLGGSQFFFFRNDFKKVNPDIVHVHGYRHPHSLMGAIFSKLDKKKVFITPHAPFGKDPRRSILLKLIDPLYDIFIGWWELKMYAKIISIAKWEKKYLQRLLVPESKIELIPNGINPLFLQNSEKVIDRISVAGIKKSGFTFLYMGRVDPVKRPEWVDEVAGRFLDYKFKIFGPLSGYEKFEAKNKNVEVVLKKFTKEEFVQEADNSDFYILASIREAFPFTLMEALARGCLVLSSDTKGAEEIIIEGENGFLFNSVDELETKIKYAVQNWNNMKNIRVEGYKTAQGFRAEEMGRRLVHFYEGLGANKP